MASQSAKYKYYNKQRQWHASLRLNNKTTPQEKTLPRSFTHLSEVSTESLRS